MLTKAETTDGEDGLRECEQGVAMTSGAGESQAWCAVR